MLFGLLLLASTSPIFGQMAEVTAARVQAPERNASSPIGLTEAPPKIAEHHSAAVQDEVPVSRRLGFSRIVNPSVLGEVNLTETRKWREAESGLDKMNGKSKPDDDEEEEEKFHWKPALAQSSLFLAIKHGARLFQKKTYRELGGPFFRDWGNSIKNLRGWNDGDGPFTNNLAHPLQGSVTGWIFINNSDRAKRQEFGKSREYWKSRFKALAWSTVWSTQFEFGPVSEATIGNVGLRRKNGHSTAAWTDLVLTPIVGTAIVVEEDIVDKYILKNWIERKSNGVTTRVKVLRSLLTPTASFSNLLRGRYPWKREAR
ncbi:MAG: hypothetical protein DCC44_01105 [Acidobacteria bacterium]|nr:MAG: hypothetical protein DCC44_01105 [Acidobacteriota bacterium]